MNFQSLEVCIWLFLSNIMAAKQMTKAGISLKVPFVQDMDVTQVPTQYIRYDQNTPTIPGSSSSPQVPVIDMHNLLSEDQSVHHSELQNLHNACKEWGFFQLINHEVSSSLVEKMKFETQEFFKLPLEEKKKYSKEEGDVEGYGQAFVMSEEQKLDWADMLYLNTLPAHIRKPHLLPKLPLSFRDTMEAYSVAIENTGIKILNLIAKSLEMNPGDMEMIFNECTQSMRINYYPPCPQPEKVIGLAPHSDAGGLTILLQGNEVEGLQVRKDGAWIPVKPLPSAFIVNIGDILEVVTNGIYPSIEHRATVNSEKARTSIATFIMPNQDADLGPAPSLISSKGSPPKFGRTSFADYLKGYLSHELAGKSYLDTLRI